MSPGGGCGRERLRGFPRVSGDEPDQAVAAVPKVLFSPRERG